MNVIETKNNVHLDGFATTITVAVGNVMPQYAKITAAIGFIFDDGKLLMANIQKDNRGWDIPGGHVEKGEMPEETLIREVYEETGVVVQTPKNFGYIQYIINGDIPVDYPYPYPDTYIILYFAEYVSVGTFHKTEESHGGEFKTIEEVRNTECYKKNSVLFEYVLQNSKV